MLNVSNKSKHYSFIFVFGLVLAAVGHAANINLPFSANYWISDGQWSANSDTQAWSQQYNTTSSQVLYLAIGNLPTGYSLKFDWSVTNSIPNQTLWIRKGDGGSALKQITGGSQTGVTVALDAGTYDMEFAYLRTSNVGGYSLATVSNVVLDGPAGLTADPNAQVSRNSIALQWTTDETAKSRVLYGATADLGSATTLETSLATTHSATLNGLADSSAVYYRIESTDSSGKVSTSGLYRSFTVPNLSIQGNGTSVSLSWKSDAQQWKVQSATNLNANYSELSGTPTVDTNALETLTVPVSGPSQFFRLQKSTNSAAVYVSP